MVRGNLPSNDPREVLRRLSEERGEDFAALSRLIGRNAAYVQQFIRRGTPKRLPERERRILSRHFGIAEQLLGAEEGTARSDLISPAVIEGAGKPTDARLAFAPSWLDRLTEAGPGAIRLMRVEGDAMAPTLQEGDDLLVDTEDQAGRLRDGLYVLAAEGRPQVRRLTMHPIRLEVTVQSDNPTYADWPGLRPDELELVGRVIWTGRRMP